MVPVARSSALLLLALAVPAQEGASVHDKDPIREARGAEFWSFQPPRDQKVPRPADQTWPRGPIDRFLLVRMEAAGLKPASPAGVRSLLRRLSFDLTGLPPTPVMIDGFVRDSSDAAFDRVVDWLLASKEFGERWGRHWLDVVRFAESSGGGRSLMFAHAWRFRDYVIAAYNEDRRFDVFLSEQIAGDLLPHDNEAQRNRQLIATGFLELGPTNYELQDKELLRMEVIDEQIDTLGRAVLGLTLGCARCHDHKFDPIPTTDYYALAGIFGSTQVLTSGNVSGHVQRELTSDRSRKRKDYDLRIESIRRELAKLRGVRRVGKSRPRVLERAALIGIVLDDRDAERIGNWIGSTSVAGYLDGGYIHDGDTEKGRKSVVFTPEVPRAGLYEVRMSYTSGTNRASNTPVRIEGADGAKLVRLDQRLAPSPDGFVSVGRYRLARGRVNTITVSNDRTDGHVIVDGLQLISREAAKPAKPPPSVAHIAGLTAELQRLEKTKPAAELAMAVRDVSSPADGHVHVRGLVRKKGPRVPRGFVTVCGGGKPNIPDGQSGRLQLAEWLTRTTHPLTARVYVNRVWHHLFGEGLVRTTDNFGLMGERPSHPELLDWLARRFMAEGWSTKQLVRELVRSRAYRMAVGPSSQQDSENRLLSHANRRRLDAESIRDAILQISGQLDKTIGGSTIRKFSQYDYNYAFRSRRRSVYVPRFRSNRMEIFDVFDAADPSLVTGARNVSNVSTQALYLMNSPWVMEQARHASIRLLKAEVASLDQRLARAYDLVVGRPPSAKERRLALRYLASFGADETEAFANMFHTLFACLDFRYLD